MSTRALRAAFTGLAAALVLGSASARADTTNEVHFQRGTSQASLVGHAAGYAVAHYRFRARHAQTLRAQLRASNPALMFNVVGPSGQMISDGSNLETQSVTLALPYDGAYSIDVYFMRNEARRGAASSYTLTMSILR
jgi:hypothetical protein